MGNLSYQVVLPILVDLEDPVLHVVVHVVDLVHPLHAVDHHLAQAACLARDHPLEVGHHLESKKILSRKANPQAYPPFYCFVEF